jgi:hypothetical protein
MLVISSHDAAAISTKPKFIIKLSNKMSINNIGHTRLVSGGH